MKKSALFLFLLLTFSLLSQNVITPQLNGSDFWQKVRFGGGFQLGIGNNFTNIGLAPIAIYPLTEKISVGAGVQFSYLSQRDFYQAYLYGGSIITLFSPINDIQLSMEMEQLMVNRTFENPKFKDNFWNTALFLGAGYQTDFAVIGIRYNVLFKRQDNIYGEPWMPFVRIIF